MGVSQGPSCDLSVAGSCGYSRGQFHGTLRGHSQGSIGSSAVLKHQGTPGYVPASHLHPGITQHCHLRPTAPFPSPLHLGTTQNLTRYPPPRAPQLVFLTRPSHPQPSPPLSGYFYPS